MKGAMLTLASLEGGLSGFAGFREMDCSAGCVC